MIGKNGPYRVEAFSRKDRLLHAGGRLVQVPTIKQPCTMMPESWQRRTKRCAVVIFRVAPVIVVLLHAMDDFDVATLESYAKEPGPGLMQG